MPEAILTILKFCFLALLYLFLFRVVRVVYLELGGRAGTKTPKAAAPRKGRGRRGGPPVLKIVAPAERKGHSYDVGEEVTVGRAAACHISLNDDTYVSQMHARVFAREGDVFVEDLGSTNGTYLNQKKLTCEMPVRRGDRIQIGKTVMELSR